MECLPIHIHCDECHTYWKEESNMTTLERKQCEKMHEAYFTVVGHLLKRNNRHRCPFFVDHEAFIGKKPIDPLWYQKSINAAHGVNQFAPSLCKPAEAPATNTQVVDATITMTGTVPIVIDTPPEVKKDGE